MPSLLVWPGLVLRRKQGTAELSVPFSSRKRPSPECAAAAAAAAVATPQAGTNGVGRWARARAGDSSLAGSCRLVGASPFSFRLLALACPRARGAALRRCLSAGATGSAKRTTQNEATNTVADDTHRGDTTEEGHRPVHQTGPHASGRMNSRFLVLVRSSLMNCEARNEILCKTKTHHRKTK